MTTLYDIPQNSFQKEALINANTKAVSASGLFSEKKISGLNWYYFGGDYLNESGVVQSISDSFITCTANKNVYVMFDLVTATIVKNEVDTSVIYSDSNFDENKIRIAYLTTNATQITSSVNKKIIPLIPKGISPLFQSTLNPASDTVLGGVKIPLDSQIYIDSSDNIYLKDTQSIVVNASTSPLYTPFNKSVIWKIDNTAAYTVYLPNSTGLVEQDTIIEYLALNDALITFNASGTDTIDGYRISSVTSITSLEVKGKNKGLFRFILKDKTAKKWMLLEENDVIDIQNSGTTIATSIDKLNFNDSFTLTETSTGTVLIETTHNKLTVKDEGTDLSTNTKSINFVGAGVTATASGNDVTVTISGGGGGGSSGITIKDDGTALTTDATALNFAGNLVTATGTGTEKTITINNNYTKITLTSDFTITGGVNTLFTQITPFNVDLLANETYEVDFFGSILTSTTAAGGGYAMNFFCTDSNAVVSGAFETYGVSAAHNSYLIPSAAYTNASNPLKAILNGNGELSMSGISARQSNNPMIVRLRGYIRPTANCTFYIKARTSDTAVPTTVTGTLYTGSTLIIKKI